MPRLPGWYLYGTPQTPEFPRMHGSSNLMLELMVHRPAADHMRGTLTVDYRCCLITLEYGAPSGRTPTRPAKVRKSPSTSSGLLLHRWVPNNRNRRDLVRGSGSIREQQLSLSGQESVGTSLCVSVSLSLNVCHCLSLSDLVRAR